MLKILYQDDLSTVCAKPAGAALQRISQWMPAHWGQPCHRLDRGCSGALLVSRGEAVPCQVRYLAVVRGYAPGSLERFSLPFRIGRFPTARYSLVEVEMQAEPTRHQVRRHLRDLGHPILGDQRYGDKLHNRWFLQVLGWKRLALASLAVRFRDQTVECPPAWDLVALSESLRQFHVPAGGCGGDCQPCAYGPESDDL